MTNFDFLNFPRFFLLLSLIMTSLNFNSQQQIQISVKGYFETYCFDVQIIFNSFVTNLDFITLQLSLCPLCISKAVLSQISIQLIFQFICNLSNWFYFDLPIIILYTFNFSCEFFSDVMKQKGLCLRFRSMGQIKILARFKELFQSNSMRTKPNLYF